MKVSALLPTGIIATVLLTAGIACAGDWDEQGHRTHTPSGQTECAHSHPSTPFTGLSSDDQKILHNAMMAAHKQNKPLEEKIRILHEDLHALLIAPAFDKEMYLAKKRKLYALEAKAKANMENAFASAVAQFSPQERKTLAKFHEMGHHHPQWQHEGWSHHNEEESYHQPETD